MGFTFELDDLRVFFPYDTIYPEQYKYMVELKKALDAKGHAVLEMPTGTGKTVTVLSLVTSYQYANPHIGRLIYCTRTVPEMSKCLEELRTVVDFRVSVLDAEREAKEAVASKEAAIADGDAEMGDAKKPSGGKARAAADLDRRARGYILGIGMSARRNLCVHPDVSREGDRDRIDEMCRQMTSPWVREQAKGKDGNKHKLCAHYEKYETAISNQSLTLETGVYTVEDLKAKGFEEEFGWCPYFTARRLIQSADVLVMSYQYVLDPKVSMASQLGGGDIMPSSKSFASGKAQQNEGYTEPSIVVFDEAHNIDDVCIESLTVRLNRQRLDQSSANLQRLGTEVERMKKEDSGRLQAEYQQLVQGLQQAGQIDSHMAERLASPLLPDDLVREAIPGNIRRAEHFISLLRRIVNFLRRYLQVEQAQSEGPLSMLHKFEEDIEVDAKSLKFCHERLRSLLNTLRVSNLDEFTPITKVADFVTLLATYAQGFTIITDPYPEAQGIYDPTLLLRCLDASLAIRPVLKRYQTVVLTSGTISPLEMYPKILGMTNVITTQSFSITMERKCLCPLIVTHGPDQVPITSRFALREDPSVVHNYGELLEQLVKTVPDGMVCFFTSYRYMEAVLEKWYETGVIARVLKHKLLFIETKDVVATTYALNLYRQACDSGQGAVFLSVARGKVAEGIDFDKHYGRCVVLFGVPFQYSLSRELRARLEFLKDQYGIDEAEWLNFDAMRQASQCLGRVIRSKKDYGVMIFADQRYARADKRSKIPTWIQAFLEPQHIVMATDVAIQAARQFLLRMSQPYQEPTGANASVLTPEAVRELQRKSRPEVAAELNGAPDQEVADAPDLEAAAGSGEAEAEPAAKKTKTVSVEEDLFGDEDDDDEAIFGKDSPPLPAKDSGAAAPQGQRDPWAGL